MDGYESVVSANSILSISWARQDSELTPGISYTYVERGMGLWSGAESEWAGDWI